MIYTYEYHLFCFHIIHVMVKCYNIAVSNMLIESDVRHIRMNDETQGRC